VRVSNGYLRRARLRCASGQDRTFRLTDDAIDAVPAWLTGLQTPATSSDLHRDGCT